MAVVVTMLSVPLLMVLSAPDSLACSCVAAELPEQMQRADVVFSGRAIDRDQAAGTLVSSADPVTWTFAVDRVHKGSAGKEQKVVSAQSEVSCGFEFELRRAYLVLASGQQPEGAGPMETGLCNGTRHLSEEPADNVESPGVSVGPRAVAEPVTEAYPWGPSLVAGFGALVVCFLSVVALWRRRNRVLVSYREDPGD